MAFDIGAILGRLVLDSSKWESAIKKAKADANSFEGAILRNEGKLKRFGLALGVAGAAITAVNVKLITMAASAEESENLFEVSMGKMADSARRWSNELSDSLGLNEFEIRRTVGTLNVMIKSMGLSEKTAYNMSTSLVQLSQDMSSFYNLSPEAAFDKIQSGLVGMSRPLQELGILVNETTVKEWALTNGLIKQGQELTEQQKVLGRYAVMMEATSAAQGDLARTMDSTTNQYRRMTAGISELGVKLGTSLLPLTNIFLALMNNLIGAVTDFVDKFPALTQAVVVGVAVFGALLVPLGTLLVLLPGIASAAVAMGTTIGGALALTSGILMGIAVAAGAVYLAFKKWDLLKALFFAFSEGVNRAISDALNALSKFFDKVSEISPVMKEQFRDLRDSFQKSAVGMSENADLMAQKAVDSLVTQEEKVLEFEVNVKSSMDGIQQSATDAWSAISDEAMKSLDTVKTKQKTWLQEIQENFNVFEEMGKRTFNSLSDSLSSFFFSVMKGEITSLQALFEDFGNRVLQMIADILAQWVAMKIITGLFGAVSGTAAVAGVGGYGAGTPAGTTNMGSWSKLPSYDTGTDYVPYDMVARVHKGEKITPAEQAGKEVTQFTIHNMITSEAIAMAMASREGTNTIVNIINKDSLRNGVTRREVSKR
jgi:hypothetical protein